ncbi:MAG: DUF4357 domain-containing protein [Selenomonadaceae bacterium]|nr:DUF4357 domain-containing protein [Selenomonadaceae bacterium]
MSACGGVAGGGAIILFAFPSFGKIENNSITYNDTREEGKDTGMVKRHAPYENVSPGEVWDKLMTAEALEDCYRLRAMPTSDWNLYMEQTAQKFTRYVQRYRPELSAEMDSYEVMRKVAAFNLLAEGHGLLTGDYSLTDAMMLQLRNLEPAWFQVYLADFAAALPSMEETSGDEGAVEGNASVVVERCREILNTFPQGIDISAPLDVDKFWASYEARYDDMPGDNEDARLSILQQAGSLRGTKIFPKLNNEQQGLLQKVIASAKAKLEAGYSVVYFSQLLRQYHQELATVEIYSPEALATALAPLTDAAFYSDGVRLSPQGKTADLGQDVLNYLLERGGEPTHLDTIAGEMWQLPRTEIEKAIRSRDDIICTESKYYMAAEAFPLSRADDVPQIRRLLQEALDAEPEGKLKDEDYRPLLEDKLPTLATDTAAYSLKAFHGALGYFLHDDFRFEGHYVAHFDTDLQSAGELFRKFCDSRTRFTLEELKQFAKENSIRSLSGYYPTIREHALRLNREEFISLNMVSRSLDSNSEVVFDTEAIDAKLAMFCPDAYAPLKTVKNFLLLPMVRGANWNPFLLESYLFNVSRKFRLAHVRFSETEAIGAMVRREAIFRDYDELLKDVLAKEKTWQTEDEALNFLATEGYLGRARYDKVTALCQGARVLRQKPPEKTTIPVTLPSQAASSRIHQDFAVSRPLPPTQSATLSEQQVTDNVLNHVIFYCRRKTFQATGYASSRGFVVMKGSQVSEKIRENLERSYGPLRRQLENSGVITNSVFQQDYVFPSPSAAAGVVLGSSGNGNIEWQTINGRNFGSFGIKITNYRLTKNL